MDVREKLVDILKQAPFEGKVLDEWWWEEKIKRIADHLISNGVTVQEWIPVTEMLPEPKHEFDARNWYLVALSNGVVKELAYEFHNHSVFGYGWRETAYPVTHWMPLPEPPKGE